MKLTMTIEFEYDAELMYSDDQEAKDWFFDEVLKKGLLLHSNVIEDTLGPVKILQIHNDANKNDTLQISGKYHYYCLECRGVIFPEQWCYRCKISRVIKWVHKDCYEKAEKEYQEWTAGRLKYDGSTSSSQ